MFGREAALFVCGIGVELWVLEGFSGGIGLDIYEGMGVEWIGIDSRLLKESGR